MQLEILRSLLENNNVHVINFLQHGIDEKYINEKAKTANVNFPPELIELYKWKNGTKWEEVKLIDLWLTPGLMFFPLERAIEVYFTRADRDEYWGKNMFPVFGDGGGSFYLMDLDGSSKTYKQLFYYCVNDTDFEVIISYFDSLEASIDTIVEWYMKQAFSFHYNIDPGFTSNMTLIRSIAKQLNPKSPYWRLYDGIDFLL